MTAVVVRRPGGPEVLEPQSRPTPVPGAGELLVRNEWIGVNFVDLQHRQGTPYPVELPLVPGTEAAGVVASVGEGVSASWVGRRVAHFGHLAGVYADFTAVPQEYVVPLPDDVDTEQAAALMMAGSTAHVLTRLATSVGGRTIAVHAAAGSTGAAIVQLAKAEGATVVAITSTADKAAIATEVGADRVVVMRGDDPTGPDLAAAVRRATDGRGVDLVFDASGRATFEASLRMLADRGTLVLYGATSGHPDPIAPARLSGISGDPELRGSLGLRWVAASHYLQGPARAEAATQVLADIAAGRLAARIAGRFDLVDASSAHARLASRGVVGKLLLRAA